MRNMRYLKVILTVNALLLAALVWVMAADSTPWSTAAHAAPPKRGVPDPGEQRLNMIKELKALNKAVGELSEMLEDGKLSVEVSSMPKLEIEEGR